MVRGYARAIGPTSSVAAELWALRDGISLCISLNLLAVEFEFDAKLVVDLLSQANDPSSANDAILADCREGLKHILWLKSSTAIEKLTSVQKLLLDVK